MNNKMICAAAVAAAIAAAGSGAPTARVSMENKANTAYSDEVTVKSSENSTVKADSTFKAVDPVDNRVSYAVDFSEQRPTYDRTSDLEYEYTFEDNAASLAYLKEFFGNDSLPVDETYKGNFVRKVFNASYACSVSPNAKAYTPVDGRVVAVDDQCGSNLGNAVAVEFDSDKVFIIGHLDEVTVKAGDNVTAGQVLGVCGKTGAVYFEESPTLTLITMKKVSD